MSERPLVLITRTRPAAHELVRRVEALGMDPFECPPFELAGPEDPATVADDLLTALPADRVILTSHEAVRQAVKLAGVEALDRALLIVPGQGTAGVGRELGLRNIVFPERHGTSEAMLAMPELRDVEGLDVVILAAAGGRGLMGEVLERRGASVQRIHVYRRIACRLPERLDARIEASRNLVTLGASLEAVRGLDEGLSDSARGLVHAACLVVPSRRVAEQARQLGFERCFVAAGAGDDAMLAELSRLT